MNNNLLNRNFNTFIDYLEFQLELYPQLEIQDLLKFGYQHHLGNNHFIASDQIVLDRITKEFEEVVPNRNHLIYEKISDNWFRLHFQALKLNQANAKVIAAAFIKSAGQVSDDYRKLIVSLAIIKDYLLDKQLFTTDQIQMIFDQYQKLNYPMVHHSHRFRDTYFPHYRLIHVSQLEYLKNNLELI